MRKRTIWEELETTHDGPWHEYVARAMKLFASISPVNHARQKMFMANPTWCVGENVKCGGSEWRHCQTTNRYPDIPRNVTCMCVFRRSKEHLRIELSCFSVRAVNVFFPNAGKSCGEIKKPSGEKHLTFLGYHNGINQTRRRDIRGRKINELCKTLWNRENTSKRLNCVQKIYIILITL